MTRDGDGAVEVVELIAVEADGLLAAPAETFRPRQVAKRDALHALVLLEGDFDSLVCALRFKDMRRRVVA